MLAPTRRYLVPLVAAVFACASPSGPTGQNSGIAAAVEELRGAGTTPVVADLFRFTAHVASALVTGESGCAWMFDLTTRSYEATSCGASGEMVTIYRIGGVDLPHRGTLLPLDLPLLPVGTLRLDAATCPSNLTVHDGERTLLSACGAGASWTGSLSTPGGTFALTGERQVVADPPARMRHLITFSRAGTSAVLRHDIVIGVERAESELTVSAGGVTFRMEGFAGSVGPAYHSTLDGAPAGSISWQGNAGFVTSGSTGGTATPEEDRRLRAGEHLIRALGRLGSGVDFLMGVR